MQQSLAVWALAAATGIADVAGAGAASSLDLHADTPAKRPLAANRIQRSVWARPDMTGSLAGTAAAQRQDRQHQQNTRAVVAFRTSRDTAAAAPVVLALLGLFHAPIDGHHCV